MPAIVSRLFVALLVLAAPVGVYLLPEKSPYPAAWDARVLDVVAFVEKERGLTFAHPVKVEFLEEAAFVEQVRTPKAEAKEDLEELEQAVAELRALGLIAGDPDLGEAMNELVGKSVVGLYVYTTKTMYVRGTALTPYVRATLAHELTHALQDQHFDLAALAKQAPLGAEVATRALVEGDAVRIEQAYTAALSEIDQQAHATAEAEAAERADSTDEVPQILDDLLSFPYVFGPTLLDVLVADGGNSSVDKAFRHPPTTEAQVMDPRNYPLDGKPAKVADPTLPEGLKALDKGAAFGQFSLYEVLGAQLGYVRAWEAVRGWAGDRYVTYRQDGKTCLALEVEVADEAQAATLGSAFDTWSARTTKATVDTAGRRVSVRTCDPGTEVAPKEYEPRAFDVLATRAQLIHYLMSEERVGFLRARCASDSVLATLGDKAFLAASEDGATAAEQEAVGRAFQKAVQTC